MDARQTILMLLAARSAGGTVCPSEAARALVAASGDVGSEAWREAMPTVHAAVDHLVAKGQIALSWRGKALSRRAGPYRIGQSERGLKTD
jgi:hypothetical protein